MKLSDQRLDRRSNFLDALRAIAIIFVVLGHYFHKIFPGSGIGVGIFFALSGFLITKTLLEGEPKQTIFQFYIRRFMRIWPPYVVAIGLNYIAMCIGHNSQRGGLVSSLPGLLTFTRTPSIHEWGTAVFWTLYVEFWFYLTIPIIFLAVKQSSSRVIALIFICCGSTASLFYLSHHQALYDRLLHACPIDAVAWISLLFLGALVALAERRAAPVAISAGHFSKISCTCFLALLAIVLFMSSDDTTLIWPLECTLASAITAFWIWSWRRSTQDYQNSPVIFIGRISYSIYLIHTIPLDYVTQIPWPNVQFLADSKRWGIMVCAILAATVMHYLVEKPAMRLGRYLAKMRRTSAAPALATLPEQPTSA